MERKQINFPVTEKEHEAIKNIATKERKTIKQLFLSMLDKLYPDWEQENNKKNGSN